MANKGWFDKTAVNGGLFDSTALSSGWFDRQFLESVVTVAAVVAKAKAILQAVSRAATW